MREVFTMWRHTKMVVLVALTAGVYAAILIPLKGIPLIPGFTELRPANAIPYSVKSRLHSRIFTRLSSVLSPSELH